MTQETERKALFWTALGSLALAVVFFVLTFAAYEQDRLWEPFFVLFLGLACECFMRLLLLGNVPYGHDHRFPTNSGWFQKHKPDQFLVGHPSTLWNRDFPYYDPEAFSTGELAADTVVQNTCTYELYNEVNALLAFLVLVLAVGADNKGLSIAILAVLSLVFCLYALLSALRARLFRFHVKAGRA